MSKKNLLLIAFCLINHFNYSQNSKIDSINNSIRNHSLKDTTRVNLLIEKASLYKHVDIDSTYVYATKGLQLATQLNFSKGKGKNLLLISDYFIKQHQFKKAEDYTEKALVIFKHKLNIDGIVNSYRNLGDTAYGQFEYDKALVYYEKVASMHSDENNKEYLINTLGIIAEVHQKQENFIKAKESFTKILKLAREINYQRGVIMALYSLGRVNYKISNYPEALANFNQSLVIAEQAENLKIISVLIHNIGTVYLEQNNHEKSLEYFNQALLQYRENNDFRNILNILNDFGNLYKSKKEYRNALQSYTDALEIAYQLKADDIKSTILNNIGHLHIVLGNYPESIASLKKGLTWSVKTKSKERMCYSYLGLGKVYYKTRKYNAALKNALKGLQIIEELNQVKHRNEIHQLLAEVYAKMGKYEKAYENQVLFKNFTDSVFNLEATKKITQLEAEYKYREEKLSAKLKEEKLIGENKITNERLVLVKNQKLWMVIGILVLMMILVFIVMRHNLKNLQLKTKNVLTEQKLLRSQMTPHFMFNSLSVLQGIILNKEYTKSIKYISKFSSLLRLSLENSRTTLVPLEKEIKAIENYLTVQNIARSIPFRYEVSLENMNHLNNVLIPPMLIQPFVENAIEHGFRELKNHQEIKVVFAYAQENLTCEIVDNGIGVDANEKVFSNADASISTDLIEERLEMLGKKFGTNSWITIKDRRIINESGTIVTINLPYKTSKDK
ncbi:MAG: tetratricopeptide repeat protein [Flavobacteriaceae bacterium]